MFGSRFFKAFAMALALAGSLALTAVVSADKVVLKDGTVLEGKITREGDKFLYITVKVGTVETQTFVNKDDIKSVERDQPAKDAAAPDAPATPAPEKKPGGATRVALLHFGPPSDWQGANDDMVGREISAEAFRAAVPLLEKAKADVVIIRVNSGGGLTREMPRFHELFEKTYKPKFRTVAWIESAISCAAMSPWVLEEFYFMPKGNMGACTEFYGASMIASKGAELEEILFEMERASALGKKNPAIMRAMQIQSPLSVDVDENGEVHWRQDEDGQTIVNPKSKVLTITAKEAVKFKLARGIASTKEELLKVMGIQEAEWVAQDATDLVAKSLRDNDAAFKSFNKLFEQYGFHIGLAEQLQDKERRGIELAKARRLLNELRTKVRLNPNFPMFVGAGPEWFKEQEDLIKRLSQLP